MDNYYVLQTTLYDSIILSLLKRNIISLNEAFNCLNAITNQSNRNKDLHKDLIKVKQKGLTNLSFDKSESEGIDNE